MSRKRMSSVISTIHTIVTSFTLALSLCSIYIFYALTIPVNVSVRFTTQYPLVATYCLVINLIDS
jgi:hypothetical protein